MEFGVPRDDHGQDQLATHKDPLLLKILEPQPPILGLLLTRPAARGFHLKNIHMSRNGAWERKLAVIR